MNIKKEEEKKEGHLRITNSQFIILGVLTSASTLTTITKHTQK